MTEPVQNHPESREHHWLVDLVARQPSLRDWDKLSDAELEAMLDVQADAPYSLEEIERLVARCWTAASASATDRAREDLPQPPSTVLPDASSVQANTESPAFRPGPRASRNDSRNGPASPVLGFLGDLTPPWGNFTNSAWALIVMIAGLAMTLAAVLFIWGGNVHIDNPHSQAEGRMKDEGGRMKDEGLGTSFLPPLSPRSLSPSLPSTSGRGAGGEGTISSPPVARFVRSVDCRDRTVAPGPGECLKVGQSLHLATGTAEFKFDVGARVLLQGPASLEIQSHNCVRLAAGKLTTEITAKQARGFKVITPSATFVDQGTEFGVEVAPGGSSKVHVFKGLVNVDLSNQGGAVSSTHRLTANAGARIESDDQEMTIFEDAGECFVRSMNDTERDRHVIAYWRFEDRPVGTMLPHTERNTQPVRATCDSTYNGNDLFVWSPENRPLFSGDVPAAKVPQSGAANRSCLDLTDPLHSHTSRPEVYTNSRFSHASPCDIQRITPDRWTVEASVKIKNSTTRGKRSSAAMACRTRRAGSTCY